MKVMLKILVWKWILWMEGGIDSEILKSKDEFIFIKNNITKRVNKKIKNFKQIYKTSSNVDDINAFQENFLFCPNILILILILTDEKKDLGVSPNLNLN